MPDLKLWHTVITAIVLLFLGGVICGWIAIVGSVIKASREASHGISPLLEQAAEQVQDDAAEPAEQQSRLGFGLCPRRRRSPSPGRVPGSGFCLFFERGAAMGVGA